jgi:hypothetical protein
MPISRAYCLCALPIWPIADLPCLLSIAEKHVSLLTPELV